MIKKKTLLGSLRVKQSQRLRAMANEARNIRKKHEAGEITADQAAKLLSELRSQPDQFLTVHGKGAWAEAS